MKSPHNFATLSVALSIALTGVIVIWQVSAQIRRSIGRQRLSVYRTLFSAYVLPVALTLLLVSAFEHPMNALAEAGGVAVGAYAARYALRTTKFYSEGYDLYYTPNPYVGTAMLSCFVLVLAYHLMEVYQATDGFAVPPTQTEESPATVLVVGALLGYYSIYSWGLLRWRRGIQLPGKNHASTSSDA